MNDEKRRSELDELTVDELLEHARELDVAGRSTMRKDELVEAIAEAEVRGEDEPPATGARDDSGGGRRLLLFGVVALAVVVAVAVAALLLFGGGSDDDEPATDVGATKTTSNTSYTLDSVRVESALGDVSPERGRFVIVGVTVVDESPAQGLLGGPPVLLRGGDDVSYSPATVADAALGERALAGVALTPGEPGTGDVAFDVPPAALPGAELLARDLSGGAGETTFALGLGDSSAE